MCNTSIQKRVQFCARMVDKSDISLSLGSLATTCLCLLSSAFSNCIFSFLATFWSFDAFGCKATRISAASARESDILR